MSAPPSHPFHYCYYPFPDTLLPASNSVHKQQQRQQLRQQQLCPNYPLLNSMNPLFIDRNGNVINVRRYVVLALYGVSVLLSALLFFFAGVYCKVTSWLLERCSITWAEKNRQYAQFFPMAVSGLILLFSALWLFANFRRVETSCMREYNFLEMPTAVFCALLAGICAVIEIHYNFDDTYSTLYWNDKWTLAAADSVVLVFIHAGLAFALT